MWSTSFANCAHGSAGTQRSDCVFPKEWPQGESTLLMGCRNLRDYGVPYRRASLAGSRDCFRGRSSLSPNTGRLTFMSDVTRYRSFLRMWTWRSFVWINFPRSRQPIAKVTVPRRCLLSRTHTPRRDSDRVPHTLLASQTARVRHRSVNTFSSAINMAQ